MNWLTIQWLRYLKEDPERHRMADDYKQLKIKGTSTRGRQTSFSWSLPRSYGVKLLLSEVKKKDLLDLCHLEVVPQEYQFFYKPTQRQVHNKSLAWDGHERWKCDWHRRWVGRRRQHKNLCYDALIITMLDPCTTFFLHVCVCVCVCARARLGGGVMITMCVMTICVMLLAKYTLFFSV